MNLPYTSVVEQIHKKIANIKETQEELKKEVDSLVLENLKQQQKKNPIWKKYYKHWKRNKTNWKKSFKNL